MVFLYQQDVRVECAVVYRYGGVATAGVCASRGALLGECGVCRGYCVSVYVSRRCEVIGMDGHAEDDMYDWVGGVVYMVYSTGVAGGIMCGLDGSGHPKYFRGRDIRVPSIATDVLL